MRVRTPQQEAVTDFVRDGDGDAVVTARAGSGKSSTLEDGIAMVSRDCDVLVCAFNKGIADAFKQRVRSLRNVKVTTLHGLGRRTLSDALGRDVEVDKHREEKLALAIIGTECEAIGQIAELARMAKEIAPDEADQESRLREIALDFGLAGDDEDEPEWNLQRRADVARQVVVRSREVADTISYADMLYLPLALQLRPRLATKVAVDESQDMNLAQHRLAARAMRRGGSRIYVGDPRQAIYGWRGARMDGMERIAIGLKAQRFALTVTFRCALAIVEEAKRIVPDLQAREGAPEGILRTARDGELARTAQPGDFVLSRTNAPLVRTCMALWRCGAPARVVGSDLSGLFDLVRKLARGSQDISDLFAATRAWQEREVRRAAAAKRDARVEKVNDQADAIIAIGEDVDTVSDLLAKLGRLLADDKSPHVACSTIHKAKGLEADRVWVLKDTLDAMTPRTEAEQIEEANLKYVAITRARAELVWVSSS